uniref:Large ribosomal subunit protein uL3c n=1 Tax=Cyanidiococcus yangmingshanensis TaxID=2690220 RepID=A0A7G5VUL3_9RHOD|nr:50S ribosomal protein L3 [Cyanidiococcus yangmingshanensis]QMX77380.1 50S ribosomal protein L3 [Cyanidiococcus yangmingshanensis]UNJ15995.1 ribosomal protein L3 [Cyanidioschyzonaceae sp. 3]WDB00514.1 ribosomal protein L3 [Cyanidiococcus yangmingshanensis]
MSFGMLATKLGMTQLFDDNGQAMPVTLVRSGSHEVIAHKTKAKHGYTALVLRYQDWMKEFRVNDVSTYPIGSTIDITCFDKGQQVSVKGKTIGKGFAGYQKRHHFARGPMSHGSKNHRQPGSIGAGTFPARVFPGTRMSGRLGGQSCTIRGLHVVQIDASSNTIALKGAVPGKVGNLLLIMRD